MSELQDAYDKTPEFATILATMEIDRHDLDLIFTVLDEDCSGDVIYSEFVDQLQRMKSQPSQLLLFYVCQLRHRVFRWLAEQEALQPTLRTVTDTALSMPYCFENEFKDVSKNKNC